MINEAINFKMYLDRMSSSGFQRFLNMSLKCTKKKPSFQKFLHNILEANGGSTVKVENFQKKGRYIEDQEQKYFGMDFQLPASPIPQSQKNQNKFNRLPSPQR